MITYILIGGHIDKAKDGGQSFCKELISTILHRPVKILDCLFGRSEDVWKERFEYDKKFFLTNLHAFELELALPEKFIEQVKNCDVIFFQGGDPWRIMEYLSNMTNWVNELDGKVVVGSSAGADILVQYYGVGKTFNIREGLGLLPIKFIPHWNAEYEQGLKIDWNYLLQKLISYKEELEVVTLMDGEFRVIRIY